jgi:hypothetical protein
MKNDITRDTFHRVKHFSRVLMQQGRVQLDADWNEQVSILLNYLRTLTSDLLGPGAGPEAAWGFKLLVSDSDINALPLATDDKNKLIERRKTEQVLIAPGRYYVDGLLVEQEKFVSFFDQLGHPVPDDADKKLKDTDKQVVIYLDVWERHITPIEDDDIREKALGGPDTATRAKIASVVRARQFAGDEEVERGKVTLSTPPKDQELTALREALQPKFEEWSENQWKNRGFLRAGIEEQAESDDPCVSSPESVYRGMENQLYRVEIHRSGPVWDGDNEAAKSTAATFKWSRDNGSVAAAWLDGEGDTLKVTAGRDRARGFASGQWVELSDDLHDLESAPGTLVQLKETEAGSLTIDPATAKGSYAREDFPNTPKVRRWDQQETENITLAEGAIPIQYDKWFALEDGVQIQFPAPAVPDAYEFRSGDYWLIPARVASRDIEWPWERNDEGKAENAKRMRRALPPHGIKHHYALLGLLAAATGATFEFTDLRRKFAPLVSV